MYLDVPPNSRNLHCTLKEIYENQQSQRISNNSHFGLLSSTADQGLLFDFMRNMKLNKLNSFLPERYVKSPIMDAPVLFNRHLFRNIISSEWKSFALLPCLEFWSALSLTASSILWAPRSRISAALVKLYEKIQFNPINTNTLHQPQGMFVHNNNVWDKNAVDVK